MDAKDRSQRSEIRENKYKYGDDITYIMEKTTFINNNRHHLMKVYNFLKEKLIISPAYSFPNEEEFMDCLFFNIYTNF